MYEVTHTLDEILGFAEKLCSHPFVDICQEFVKQSIAALVSQFVEHTEFRALMIGAFSYEESSATSMLSVLNINAMPKTRAAGEKWFEDNVEAEAGLVMPAAQLLATFRTLVPALTCMGVTTADASGVLTAVVETAQVEAVPIGFLADIMETLMSVNCVMAGWSYIHDLMAKGALVQDNIMKPGLKAAVDVVYHHLNFATARFQQNQFVTTMSELGVETAKSRHELISWLSDVTELQEKVQCGICHQTLLGLNGLVQKVVNHTPAWEHVVSNDVYSKALATQILINHSFVDALEAELNDLHAAIFDLAGMVKKWCIKEILEASDEWVANKQKATMAHNKSRFFLRTRKGCWIVQDLKGGQQVDEAKKLMAQGTIPDKLLSALRGVVNRNGSAGNFIGKRSAEETAMDVATPTPKRGRGGGGEGAPTPPSAEASGKESAQRPVGRGRGRVRASKFAKV